MASKALPARFISHASRLRGYCSTAVGTDGLRKPVGETASKEVGNVESTSTTQESKKFWMRDPKTGNWIPESHFDEVDVALLREKLLPKRRITK